MNPSFVVENYSRNWIFSKNLYQPNIHPFFYNKFLPFKIKEDLVATGYWQVIASSDSVTHSATYDNVDRFSPENPAYRSANTSSGNYWVLLQNESMGSPMQIYMDRSSLKYSLMADYQINSISSVTSNNQIDWGLGTYSSSITGDFMISHAEDGSAFRIFKWSSRIDGSDAGRVVGWERPNIFVDGWDKFPICFFYSAGVWDDRDEEIEIVTKIQNQITQDEMITSLPIQRMTYDGLTVLKTKSYDGGNSAGISTDPTNNLVFGETISFSDPDPNNKVILGSLADIFRVSERIYSAEKFSSGKFINFSGIAVPWGGGLFL